MTSAFVEIFMPLLAMFNVGCVAYFLTNPSEYLNVEGNEQV